MRLERVQTTVTNYGYDIVTQIPETKGGLCRIEMSVGRSNMSE